MNTTKRNNEAFGLYLLLGGLFITALITCNLIANKFVTVDLGFKVFTISAGVLPYPITFLLTDILSEIYGRKKTNAVVYTGFAASLFVLMMLYLGSLFPSIEESPVNDDYYNTVFQNSWRIILASMVAYLTAQLVDVRLFHFWKKLTKGKKLWLRNNASTILSQFVDTTL
ncbi:MAG: putative integral membrane protein (TIGR00697 family), partial [Sediminicola sp.]